MNLKSFFGLALLLCIAGCGSTVSDQASSPVSSVPSPLNPAAAPHITPSVRPNISSAAPLQTPPPRVSSVPSLPGKQRIEPPTYSAPVPVQPDPSTNSGSASGSASGSSGAAAPEMERDYGLTTPIATTGTVTVRDRIRFVDSDKLLTACPTDTAPYALAESTHYRVQICSEEYDPQLPKYYIGQEKGGGELRITSSNLNEARQLTFKNGDYTYILYRDGVKPDKSNAYLEVYMPNGKSYAEALFYLYE